MLYIDIEYYGRKKKEIEELKRKCKNNATLMKRILRSEEILERRYLEQYTH